MHDGKLVSHGIYTADQLVGLNGSLGGVRSATFVLVRISADRDHDIGGVDHRVVARVKSFDHIFVIVRLGIANIDHLVSNVEHVTVVGLGERTVSSGHRLR